MYDGYKSTNAAMIRGSCNYPEAFFGGGIFADNFTAYSSAPQIVPYEFPILTTISTGDLVMNNIKSLTHHLASESLPLYLFAVFEECNPDSDTVRYFNVTNSYFTMPDNPQSNRFANIGGFIGTPRSVIQFEIHVYNNIFENIIDNVNPVVLLFSRGISKIYLTYNTFINVNSKRGLIEVQKSLLYFENNLFENITTSREPILFITLNEYFHAKNNTFTNIMGSRQTHVSHIIIDSSTSKIFIEDMYFWDWSPGKNSLLYFYKEYSGNFTLKNIIFENIESTGGYPLISATTSKGATLQNITFKDIYKFDNDDLTNVLMKFNNVDLSTSESFLFDSLTVQNSTIPLYFQDSLINSETNGGSLVFSNLDYHDCIFQFQEELISLKALYSTSDFKFKIIDSKFYNIQFVRGGKIMNLQQQIATQLVLQNLQFTGITAGFIYIGVFNKIISTTTNVLISNMTIWDCDMKSKSFISVNRGGRVDIHDSLFQSVHSSDSGPIIHSNFDQTEVNILRSNFSENTAVSGGVFLIEDNSVVRCTDWKIFKNYAISNGVFKVDSHGYFELYNTEIFENYANNIPVGSIQESVNTAIINNCKIYNNHRLTFAQVKLEISGRCSTLCFLPSRFTLSLLQSYEEQGVFNGNSTFSIIFGSLKINNMTIFYHDKIILNSFLSDIEIDNCVIRDIETDSSLLTLSSSTFTLKNSTIQDINITSPQSFIWMINFETVAIIDKVVYQSSVGSFLQTTGSTLMLNLLNISQIDSQSPHLNLLNVLNATMNDIIMNNISGTLSSLIKIMKSHISSITKFTVENWPFIALNIENSNITEINENYFKNISIGIQIKKSNVDKLTNSTFHSWGGPNNVKGGSVYLYDSSLHFSNVTFESNTASCGGAVYIECINSNTNQSCSNSFNTVIFNNNTAQVKGGAIFYDSFRPELDNIVYTNNTAVYGNELGSYPVKIILSGNSHNDINLTDLGSGIQYYKKFILSLVDYDNQEILIDNTSKIRLSGVTTDAIILGFDSAKINKGVSVFSNLRFIHSPGTTEVKFKASSQSIDSALINRIFGKQFSNNTIYVDFRWCKPGEIQQEDNTCRECSHGTYSLLWNSTEWLKWMNNAVCLGGTQIELKPGFWRNSLNSTDIVDCPREKSWIGGYNELSKFPVICDAGYQGYLCTTCSPFKGDTFMRVGIYQWEKWPNPLYNAIRVFGLLIIIIFFLIILIIINIRKSKESQKSILMRIFTNYLQLIGTSLSFGFNYPQLIYDVFSPIKKAGTTSESFLSFDWFFGDTNTSFFAPSTIIFKSSLSAILPAIMIIVASIAWYLLKCTRHRWFTDTQRNISISIICIIFLLHPTLTVLALTMFQCTDVGDGENRMTIEMEIECYSKTHLSWAFSLGGTMLILWVIGAPVLVLIILIKNRKNLQEDYMRKYFLILYQGLRPQTFYWEFVNTTRKIIMPLFNVLLSRVEVLYRTLIAVFLLTIMFRIQIRVKPYRIEANNQIEILAVLSGMVTIFWAVLFIDQIEGNEVKSVTFLKLFSLVVIFLVNAYFILRWIHIFLYSFDSSNSTFVISRRIFGYLLFHNLDEEFKYGEDFKKPFKQHKNKQIKFRLKVFISHLKIHYILNKP